MIRKEQTENGVRTLFSEISKTAPEYTESKTHPFLIMEGQKAPSEASSMGHNQEKCKRQSRENKPSLIPQRQIGQKLVVNNSHISHDLTNFPSCLSFS